VRYANVTRVADYLARLGPHAPPRRADPRRPAAAWAAEVGQDEASRDTLMLGLRLTQAGVRVEDYLRRHGTQAWAKAKGALDRLERDGLVEWTPGGGRVRLTPRGRMLGNRVFAEFV
jgi:oxygen-independent coproporphyrinogen-3 oxidase